jgi:hypothetical protein
VASLTTAVIVTAAVMVFVLTARSVTIALIPLIVVTTATAI